ncbi:MAG: phytoene/squalene synthase family protein [Rhodospirillaceae bacterium]|jgi:phytoene synthase|nr:phytoene/squalene synthase family protein [Rhodospirillaceae bacterium]
MPIDKTLSYGADLVKRYDRDRFLTALFAPNGMREPLMVLYAFNVEIARIRETVTEPVIGQMRLQWWRDTLTNISQGKGAPKGHPVAENLAALMGSRSLTLEHFLSLLDERELDMMDEPPCSMKDLIAYCRGSSVGLSLLALDVLGVNDAGSRRAAESVATAWALTGIARAVRHYALAGRVMLPGDGLKQHGLAVQSLQDPDTAGPAAALIEEVCDQAQVFLEEARVVQRSINLKALPVLLLATLADRYLADIKTAEYQIYDPRLMRQHPAVARLWWNAWRKRY